MQSQYLGERPFRCCFDREGENLECRIRDYCGGIWQVDRKLVSKSRQERPLIAGFADVACASWGLVSPNYGRHTLKTYNRKPRQPPGQQESQVSHHSIELRGLHPLGL